MTEPLPGIAISNLKFNACLINNGGKLRHRGFPNTAPGFAQLKEWLAKQGVERVAACMEATGTYSEPLALFLHEAGRRVSVSLTPFSGSSALLILPAKSFEARLAWRNILLNLALLEEDTHVSAPATCSACT